MKVFVLILAILIAFAGCNTSPEDNTTVLTAEEMFSACYEYKETGKKVSLRIIREPEQVKKDPLRITGSLSYDILENGFITGGFTGNLLGDTLIATYVYGGEMTSGEREIYFLRKGDTYIEGNLDHNSAISFENGLVLKKVSCGQ